MSPLLATYAESTKREEIGTTFSLNLNGSPPCSGPKAKQFPLWSPDRGTGCNSASRLHCLNFFESFESLIPVDYLSNRGDR